MLLDVGVWLAAVWGRHAHHQRVAGWWDSSSGDFALCRITQMGLLRLLSNLAVMGADVLTRAQAWRILDELRADERVRWAGEPPHLEHAWRALSARTEMNHTVWPDDYLAAFAQSAGIAVVTLDAAFDERYPAIRVITL